MGKKFVQSVKIVPYFDTSTKPYCLEMAYASSQQFVALFNKTKSKSFV